MKQLGCGWRALLLAGLLLGIAWPAAALAHGGGAPQVTDAPAGPYRLFVWTSPEPWQADANVHVTIAVTQQDAAGQIMPITDAQVTVRLTLDGQATQAVLLTATQIGAAAGYYDADGSLPVAGLWRAEVEASGEAGVGAVSFTQTVAPAGSTLNWIVWGGGALVVLAIVGFLSARRRQPQLLASMRNPASSSVQE
jgi:hypothetical protein